VNAEGMPPVQSGINDISASQRICAHKDWGGDRDIEGLVPQSDPVKDKAEKGYKGDKRRKYEE